MTDAAYSRSVYQLSSKERSVLDEWVIMLPYRPDPPALTLCPNCYNLLDWLDNQFECNWCCRVWDYEKVKELVVNQTLPYPERCKDLPLNIPRIQKVSCFNLLDAFDAHIVDNYLDQLLEILWIRKFIRQDGRRVVNYRDRQFCAFMYIALSDYYCIPHSYLQLRLQKLYRSLSLVLPLVMYTSSVELLRDLKDHGLDLGDRRHLDHTWWDPPPVRICGHRQLEVEYLHRMNQEMLENLARPKLAEPPDNSE